MFGAWIISKGALQAPLRPVLDSYLQQTEQSILAFRADVKGSLDRWLSRYPVDLPRAVLEDYYRVLDYRFTDERKRSLSLFLELSCRIGLVESAPALEFL